ncbi:MAG: hypothetical protein NZ561_09665, partial [Phycisphaerae bacterium]|nr:hypothetical protein [Phycisphaerae bacterium]MDW8261854.1 hypothetical protein [Phycisphaerales bacterium]
MTVWRKPEEREAPQDLLAPLLRAHFARELDGQLGSAGRRFVQPHDPVPAQPGRSTLVKWWWTSSLLAAAAAIAVVLLPT